MVKLGQKVVFGRAGGTKYKGTVVKLNPKTAHIKRSDGSVMGVSYGLIQVGGSQRKKSPVKTRSKGKKNPPPTTYAAWLVTQNKTKLRALEKALNTIAGSRSPATKDAKAKLGCVRKELKKRK